MIALATEQDGDTHEMSNTPTPAIRTIDGTRCEDFDAWSSFCVSLGELSAHQSVYVRVKSGRGEISFECEGQQKPVVFTVDLVLRAVETETVATSMMLEHSTISAVFADCPGSDKLAMVTAMQAAIREQLQRLAKRQRELVEVSELLTNIMPT